MTQRKFVPGLYRHFKGGLYYALCEAFSHEAPPDALGGAEVVYYSYEKKHWRRRPTRSPEDLPDGERVGFLDEIRREGFSPGTDRFRLVQFVPPHLALRAGDEPWVPTGPGEPVTLHAIPESPAFPLADAVRETIQELNGQTRTVSSARQRLSNVMPAGCHAEVSEGRYFLVMRFPPDHEGHRYHVPLMRFTRGDDYPPPPA